MTLSAKLGLFCVVGPKTPVNVRRDGTKKRKPDGGFPEERRTGDFPYWE